jgi:hypothetical protein
MRGKSSVRTMVLGGLAATVLLSTSAGASTMTVTQAIKAQDKIVSRNAEYKSLKHNNVKANTIAQAKALIPKLDSLKTAVARAATAVSHASATSSQKAGKSDWVKGVRLLATGLGDVASELRDIVHGKTTAAKRALTQAQHNLNAANTIGERGDRLLRLPTSD